MDHENEKQTTEYVDKNKVKLEISQILKADNICDLLTEDQRKYVGRQVVEWYEKDKQTRDGWEKKNSLALKLAMQVTETKTYPWPGAANVKFPLLTIAALQFSARVYPALIKAPDLVKYRIVGRDPQGLKASRAYRVSKYMSYQLLDEDETWEEQQDKLMIALPISGCMFKKTYFDPMSEKNRSKVIFPQDLVVHYYAKDLERSRATEIYTLYPSEVKERQLKGVYVEYKKATEPGNISNLEQHLDTDKRQGIEPPPEDKQTPREILESHCFWDLDGDGLDEPYVVTVDRQNSYALRIKARFEQIISEQSVKADKIRKQMFLLAMSVPPPEALQQMPPDQQQQILERAKQIDGQVTQMQQAIQQLLAQPPSIIRIVPKVHYTKYSFIPAPDGGYYDLGFGQLLGPINDSVDTLINQLLDAGTLQVGSQGFIGKGARIQGGRVRFEPFEWKRVQVAGSTLKESLVPLPVNAPSVVLFQLLGMMIQYAERIGSVTDVMSGENPGQNTPAYNMSAMLEQGLQVFNGVFKRIYRSFRSELRKLYSLNAEFLDPQTYFETMDGTFSVLQNDFTGDSKDLMPAADPNAFSNMESMQKAQVLAQRSAQVPGYNPVMVERRLLEALDIPDVDEVFPINPDGTYAIPPQPNPDIEIQKADMQRRTIEGKIRGEVDAARAETEHMLAQAQIMKLVAEVEQMGKPDVTAQFKILQEQMKGQREDTKGKLDLMIKEMDLLMKSKEIEVMNKQMEVAEHKADTDKQVATVKADASTKIAKNKVKQSAQASKKKPA